MIRTREKRRSRCGLTANSSLCPTGKYPCRTASRSRTIGQCDTCATYGFCDISLCWVARACTERNSIFGQLLKFNSNGSCSRNTRYFFVYVINSTACRSCNLIKRITSSRSNIRNRYILSVAVTTNRSCAQGISTIRLCALSNSDRIGARSRGIFYFHRAKNQTATGLKCYCGSFRRSCNSKFGLIGIGPRGCRRCCCNTRIGSRSHGKRSSAQTSNAIYRGYCSISCCNS